MLLANYCALYPEECRDSEILYGGLVFLLALFLIAMIVILTVGARKRP